MTDLTPEGLRGLAKDLAARLGYAAGAGESFSPLILAVFTALVAEVDKLHCDSFAHDRDKYDPKYCQACRAERAEARVREVEEASRPLLAFWESCYDVMGSIGEDDVQDAAKAAGLLIEEPHDQPCEIEGCACEEEWDWLYRESDLARRARATLAEVKG